MTEWKTLSGEPPIVIAHRGASGVLPEHTIAAYYKAIQMRADYIEPDLVITKDGHLVARHDRYLSGSTDISDRPEFADRKRTDPSREGEDWFIEDFTLAEIKTLKARQPRAGRTKAYDGSYSTGFIEEAHAAGLLVHPWTFRDDDPAEGFNHIGIELEVYYRYGVDGVFSDFTDTAFEIRQNVEDTP